MLSRALRDWRGNMGIRAAAAEIGISPTTLSRLERGGAPSPTVLAKVCARIGADESEFTGLAALNRACGELVTIASAKSLAEHIVEASKWFAKNVRTVGH